MLFFLRKSCVVTQAGLIYLYSDIHLNSNNQLIITDLECMLCLFKEIVIITYVIKGINQ